ncbi:MAG: ATP-dependent DNA helicase RecG [Micavibrio aeruginosavorus]|uniref:ATP-dependent DNA helicase RecG n=1 Tax=Micavibrio aeruginosavorus TaxID=349221 RepID=A0A7T5R493_9BACT|nr:MAG: ATP-dependent DNA helicase RecG [Micavibrio aeruginosavorus]
MPEALKKASPEATRKTGRPFALDPLFTPLTTLPGIGPRNGKLLEKLVGGPKLLDVLWHKPTDIVDRRLRPAVKDAPSGHIATFTLTVEKHTPSTRRHIPYRVRCKDETGPLDLVFFNAHKDYIEKHLPVGATVIVSGRVDHYQGRAQIVHPDAIGSIEEIDEIAAVEPVYPMTQGLTTKPLRKAVLAALDKAPALPEWQEAAWLKKNNWPTWQEALHTLHHPPGLNGISPEHPARMRLAYDELLANQLTLALVRHHSRRQSGRSLEGDGKLRAALLKAIPFNLTGAQERSLKEIYADMKDPTRMLRLLQGDVGSGKTVVAALSMLNAVECGTQAALMAPTEILARQHAESLKPWLEAAGVRHVVLTGRDKGKAREVLLQQIANGAAQIVIGTHALFQEGVEFADLGLAVIDEQHRFGVHQRLQLSSKSKATDVLVMTATPIPRTLALTAYGDMDVSRLDEKPPGRKPIKTLLLSQDKAEDLVESLFKQTKTGERVYWVCPLVEESEALDLAAATERYEILQARFGDRVGLIHGRLKPDEKDDVMRKFASGELSALVATTVIEVGVNVPEATIMVIEHAERFGLAQLHQLRGRVGRGGAKSYCFLVYASPLSETAKERLSTMRETEDGFLIAEKDLKLRGSGEILGTRQSGLVQFRLADLAFHGELLAAARDDARLIIEKDVELQSVRGNALRHLLYLFERDQAIAYLRSG